MTGSRQTYTGRDVGGAGMLGLSVTLACTGIGVGIGVLVGAVAPLLLVGFAVGFFLGIGVVVRRFRNL